MLHFRGVSYALMLFLAASERTLVSAKRIRELSMTSTSEEGDSSAQRESAGQEFEDFMTRRCIVSHVEKWWLGKMPTGVPHLANLTKNDPASNQFLRDKVAAYLEVEDALLNHRSNSGMMKKLVSKWRSSTKKDLNQRLQEADEDLKRLGFDYQAIRRRCTLGLTGEAYKCMAEHADKHESKITRNFALAQFVQARCNLEDHLTYVDRYTRHEQNQLKEALQIVKETIKAHGFSYYHTMKSCKKETAKAAKELRRMTVEDLSAGTPTSWFSFQCFEAEDKMCPEGTSAQTKRRIDVTKGAAAAFVVFWGAQVLKVLGGGLIGALAGIPGGPAGMAAGGLSGMAVGAVVPGPTPLSAAAFFWASTGPRECACFPRDCLHDEEQDACTIEGSDKAPSKNPYGRAMPYMSTKCVKKVKNSKKCEMQTCEEKDYASPLEMPGTTFFGKIGTQSGEVFHCLSKDGTMSGALPLKTILWNGKNNTAASRVELFRSLVPPVPEFKDNMHVEDGKDAPSTGKLEFGDDMEESESF